MPTCRGKNLQKYLHPKRHRAPAARHRQLVESSRLRWWRVLLPGHYGRRADRIMESSPHLAGLHGQSGLPGPDIPVSAYKETKRQMNTKTAHQIIHCIAGALAISLGGEACATTVKWPVGVSSKVNHDCGQHISQTCIHTRYESVPVTLTEQEESERPCANTGWTQCVVVSYGLTGAALVHFSKNSFFALVPQGRDATWPEIAEAAVKEFSGNTYVNWGGLDTNLSNCMLIAVSGNPDSVHLVARPNNLGMACDAIAPPQDEWCAPTIDSLTFDFKTVKNPISSASLTKTLGVYCTSPLAYKLKLVGYPQGSIPLSNGLFATLTANSKTMGETLQGAVGTQSVSLTAQLSGTGSSGGFSGSSVLMVDYP